MFPVNRGTVNRGMTVILFNANYDRKFLPINANFCQWSPGTLLNRILINFYCEFDGPNLKDEFLEIYLLYDHSIWRVHCKGLKNTNRIVISIILTSGG